MKWTTLMLAVGALALGTGCGEDDASEPEPATTGDGTLVTYSREGGVASMPVELTIGADGSARLVSEFDGQAEDFALDDAELEELTTELEAADLDAFEPPVEPSGCADCFVYTVTYGDAVVSYDDTAAPPGEITALVGHLDELAVEHTPSPS
jgi:hypothetical protein